MTGPSVPLINAGTKTASRRVITPQPVLFINGWWEWQRTPRAKTTWHAETWHREQRTAPIDGSSPYGRPGNILWIRESFAIVEQDRTGSGRTAPYLAYRADGEIPGTKWKAPFFLPEASSRLKIRLTQVRAEQLQEITQEDAIAEGVRLEGNGYTYPGCPACFDSAAQAYLHWWDKINAKRGYPASSNPWVWCLNFERYIPQEDL